RGHRGRRTGSSSVAGAAGADGLSSRALEQPARGGDQRSTQGAGERTDAQSEGTLPWWPGALAADAADERETGRWRAVRGGHRADPRKEPMEFLDAPVGPGLLLRWPGRSFDLEWRRLDRFR